jgi:hypothetical protein
MAMDLQEYLTKQRAVDDLRYVERLRGLRDAQLEVVDPLVTDMLALFARIEAAVPDAPPGSQEAAIRLVIEIAQRQRDQQRRRGQAPLEESRMAEKVGDDLDYLVELHGVDQVRAWMEQRLSQRQG